MSAGAVEIAVRGELAELSPATRRRLLERTLRTDPHIEARVREIVADVRDRGDAALLDLAEELDGVRLETLEVDAATRQEALAGLDPRLRAALEQAARALAEVARDQLPTPTSSRPTEGVTVGSRPVPLRRVGAYAPGGRAAYPSSVLMCAIPARVAGVEEIVLASPPGADGLPAPVLLAAAEIAGVDRLFALGGAGAIAALAYGTASVPAVDKIVGPGNAWVEEAKLQVARDVAIDCPAGPSEILVIADEDADPGAVAAELLAQAEHDPAARAVLLTPASALIEGVEGQLELQLAKLPTAATARRSLAANGALLRVTDLEAALAFAEEYAPEHLLLAGGRAAVLAAEVRCAGSVFFGAGASVAFGDYASGGNHVLPTGGRARAWSGLSARDFVRTLSWQRIEPAGATTLAPIVGALAAAEGLPAHGAAAERAASTATPSATGSDVRRTDRAVPPGIRATRRYDPGRRECEVELSDNTNLFGSAPAALALVAEGADERLRRYPTVYGDRLKVAIADWLGMAPENVATGCGSDDLLDSAFHAFAGNGGRIAYAEPTFSMVRAFGTANDARLQPFRCNADLEPDLEALANAEADVVYLCRPDNPSGRAVAEAATLRLIERTRGAVVVDEAYMAFAEEPSLAPRAPDLPGLVVLGTFSKAWGLAGLRIGYAVAAAEQIDLIERARGPYKLNAVAEAAAAAALEHDREWLAATIDRARAARRALSEAIASRGLPQVPSSGNFLFVRTADAAGTAAALRRHGVGVRPFTDVPGGDGIRVTVGPAAARTAFLEALDAVIAAAPELVGPTAAEGVGS